MMNLLSPLRNERSGFGLLSSILALSTLAILAATLSQRSLLVDFQVAQIRYDLEVYEARRVATWLAAKHIAEDRRNGVIAPASFGFDLGGRAWEVDVRNTAGLLDLNAAPATLLRDILDPLGVSSGALLDQRASGIGLRRVGDLLTNGTMSIHDYLTVRDHLTVHSGLPWIVPEQADPDLIARQPSSAEPTRLPRFYAVTLYDSLGVRHGRMTMTVTTAADFAVDLHDVE